MAIHCWLLTTCAGQTTWPIRLRNQPCISPYIVGAGTILEYVAHITSSVGMPTLASFDVCFLKMLIHRNL